MYPNLRAEMARAKMTIAMLAKVIGVTEGTMSKKNSGKAPLTLDECSKIKTALHSDLTLEQLFEKESEVV